MRTREGVMKFTDEIHGFVLQNWDRILQLEQAKEQTEEWFEKQVLTQLKKEILGAEWGQRIRAEVQVDADGLWVRPGEGWSGKRSWECWIELADVSLAGQLRGEEDDLATVGLYVEGPKKFVAAASKQIRPAAPYDLGPTVKKKHAHLAWRSLNALEPTARREDELDLSALLEAVER